MKDGIVLFYCQDEILYPVALTAEQQQILEMTASLFSPLTVVSNKPQGKAVNLLNRQKGAVTTE